MLRKKYILPGSLLILVLVISSFTTRCFRKKQGVKGTVLVVTGNQMPSPDVPIAGPKSQTAPTASAYGNLGNILATRGDLKGAEAMHRKALALNQLQRLLNNAVGAEGLTLL